jgi:O-acetyl-ADP-ribose deacetylase (regulator of RNase III)
MKLALAHDLTIAFPAISCGIYGFPVGLAAKIAIDTLREFVATANPIRKILLACLEEDVFHPYSAQAAPIDRLLP